MFIWRKLTVDTSTTFDVSLDWHSFCHSLQIRNADQRTKNAATRCVLRAYNRLQQNATAFGAPLRTRSSAPDPEGELTAIPIDPMEALQGRPPTQNFGCEGHNTFGPTNSRHVHSLILFANSLKLVPPDARF